MNLRPPGYEPGELPDCSTPRRGLQCSASIKGLQRTVERLTRRHDRADERARGRRQPPVGLEHDGDPQPGLFIVDVWDSPESFGRFAETKIAAAGHLGDAHLRVVPVYNRLAGKTPVSA